jgi:hypothetical protein
MAACSVESASVAIRSSDLSGENRAVALYITDLPSTRSAGTISRRLPEPAKGQEGGYANHSGWTKVVCR